MAIRQLRGPLTSFEVRRVRRAIREALRAGAPLNALLTIHPGRLAQPPSDTGQFFRRRVIAWPGTWFQRNGCAWSAVWVRENYRGTDREHLHMLLHLPKHLQRKLQRALARRWPEQEAVDLRPVYDPDGALAYLVKQRTAQADVSLGRPVRREHRCRHTHQPVADVLGRRVSMTVELERLVQQEQRSGSGTARNSPASHLGWMLRAGGRDAR